MIHFAFKTRAKEAHGIDDMTRKDYRLPRTIYSQITLADAAQQKYRRLAGAASPLVRSRERHDDLPRSQQAILF